MRKVPPLVMVAAVLAAGSLAYAGLPVLDGSKITERALPNGLRLVVKEERQWPVVAVGLYVRVGSLHEAKGEEGAAHVLEHMLFETTDDSGEKLSPQIEALGGQITASTMRDFTRVEVVVASRYLEQVLPLLTKSAFEAPLDPKALKRELNVVRQEMTDRQERADNALDDLLWALAFKDHPYGRPIGGRPEEISRLTPEVLSSFRQKWYSPSNMSVVVVGDVDPNWLGNRLTELTAKYPGRPVTWTEPAPESAPDHPRLRLEKLARDVSLLGYAWHAPSVADKTAVCAMDLIYTILGQGPAGRLNKRLVQEKQVALSVDTEFLTQKAPGLMIISALVPRGREQEAQVMILDEIRRLDEEPVSAEELQLAKRLLYADYAFTNESYDDQVGSLGFYESIDNYRFAVDYINQVMAITPEQIQAVVRKYLRRDSYSLVVLEGQRGARAGEAGTQL